MSRGDELEQGLPEFGTPRETLRSSIACTGGGCGSSGGSPPSSQAPPPSAPSSSAPPLAVGAGGWIAVGFAALLLGLVVVTVPMYFRPLPAGALLSRHSDRTLAAATVSVRRGTPIEPPDLERDACTQVRRGLRVLHLNAGWMPVLGASWTLGLSVGSAGPVFAAIGVVPILLGLGFLAQSGLIQRRLDALAATRTGLH